MSTGPAPLRARIVTGGRPLAPSERQALVRWLIGGILPELDTADRLLGEIHQAEETRREGELHDISQQLEELQARRRELTRRGRESDAA